MRRELFRVCGTQGESRRSRVDKERIALHLLDRCAAIRVLLFARSVMTLAVDVGEIYTQYCLGPDKTASPRCLEFSYSGL